MTKLVKILGNKVFKLIKGKAVRNTWQIVP